MTEEEQRKVIVVLKKLQKYIFSLNGNNGMAKSDGKSFIYKESTLPILVSAPHAVRQVRDGEIKVSDYLTGPLAALLSYMTKCDRFMRVYNDNSDPNYPVGETLEIEQIEDMYLKDLIAYVRLTKPKLVIDLHGCKENIDYDYSLYIPPTCDIDIVTTLDKIFQKHGLTADKTRHFKGGQVTRQMEQITNAIQLEIGKNLRPSININEKYSDIDLLKYKKLIAFISAMTEFIRTIDKKYKINLDEPVFKKRGK